MNANELFHDLGYIFHHRDNELIYHERYTKVTFELMYHDILIKYDGHVTPLTPEEIKAMYLKCKELGWYD